MINENDQYPYRLPLTLVEMSIPYEQITFFTVAIKQDLKLTDVEMKDLVLNMKHEYDNANKIKR